ncbi:MAG: hypothetical protein H7X83_00525 [Verrucomicrobia bacterium]|nr:hypothetical protein [Deltaproteobacteria bacterium]
MSQIRIPSLALGLLLSLSFIVLSGCGDKNSKADLDPTSGKHPASWLPADHAIAANNHSDACTECHGGDFSGGISNIACTKCHLGNQGKVHPVLWGQFAYALHGAYVKTNGTARCAAASCHGTTLSGVAGSGPACLSCHMGSNTAIHPLTWIPRFTTAPGISPTNLPDHGAYVNNNGSAACVNAVCHGTDGQGVFLSGRSCRACHV